MSPFYGGGRAEGETPVSGLPATLRIGHLRYAVAADLERCEAEECEGVTYGDQAKILIRGDRTPEANAAVLLHEILHASLYAAGFRASATLGPDGLSGDAAEEALVKAAAGPLSAALRDNPGLVAYLTAP